MRAWLGKLLLVVAVGAGGCGEGPRDVAAPLDRFTFPTGLALAPLAPAAPGAPPRNALVVVSSNFDLRYARGEGGSVLVVDPEASNGDALVKLGEGVRIASFAGEVAVASGLSVSSPGLARPPDPTCPGLPGQATIVVASRSENVVYRLAMDGSGNVSCGEGCRTDLPSSVGDPFGVQVVCPPGGEPIAYVSHLRSPRDTGWLSRVPLVGGAPTLVAALDAPTGSLAYDAGRQRLYVTSRFAEREHAPLRWLDVLSSAPVVQDLWSPSRGWELRSIAVSRDGARAYAAVQEFDPDVATTSGRAFELGGQLVVLDLRPTAEGRAPTVLRAVPIAGGPNQVAIVPRESVPGAEGRPRDLVVVTSSRESEVTIYDDEAGAVAAILGRDPRTGERLFGEQPFGLAVEVLAATERRVYVGSFDRGFVSVVRLDVNAPALAHVVKRFGREAP